jgi:hypothetical protein
MDNQDQPLQAGQAFSEQPDNPAQERPHRHSGPGIASFVITLVMYLLLIAGIIAAFLTARDAVTPDGVLDEDVLQEKIGQFAAAGIMLIASGIGQLVALVLGIIGIVQKERRKAFAVTGTILSGLAVLLMIGFLIIGVVLGSIAAV